MCSWLRADMAECATAQHSSESIVISELDCNQDGGIVCWTAGPVPSGGADRSVHLLLLARYSVTGAGVAILGLRPAWPAVPDLQWSAAEKLPAPADFGVFGSAG